MTGRCVERRGRPSLIILAIATLPFVFPVPARGELGGYDCLIEAHEVVDVSTREEGVIEEFLVDRGDLVEEGQTLAHLESEVEKATVELARARTNMKAIIEERRENLEFAKRQSERSEELFGKKAIPFHEMDKTATDARTAALQLQQAIHEQRVARLELTRAQSSLNQRTIRSPIRGVVVQRLVARGESVKDQPILQLAQVDPLKVEVIVPVTDFGRIEPGMRAAVQPLLPGAEASIATVTIVDRVIDAASGTFGVRLELANPDYRLPGGLKCDIRFFEGGS